VYDQRLCLDLRWRAGRVQRVAWRTDSMLFFMYTVLGTHWPFFVCRIPSSNNKTSSVQRLVDGFALVGWTLTTATERETHEAEQNLRRLAYTSFEDDQERFTQLISFRRDVAHCYGHLKSLHKVVETYLELSESHISFYEEMYRVASHTQPLVETERENLKRPLRSHLAKLEAQLDAVQEDLNDEIQVVGGTVQVRDAQIMKEQARVMGRQATWTVALTVLAAAYLPMTLVTGIFSMNITEISSEATAPNAWCAFGAWAVVFLVTSASLLAYVLLCRWRARRQAEVRRTDIGSHLQINQLEIVTVQDVLRRMEEERGVEQAVSPDVGFTKKLGNWVRDIRQKKKKKKSI
jgi:hypothetical protein